MQQFDSRHNLVLDYVTWLDIFNDQNGIGQEVPSKPSETNFQEGGHIASGCGGTDDWRSSANNIRSTLFSRTVYRKKDMVAVRVCRLVSVILGWKGRGIVNRRKKQTC